MSMNPAQAAAPTAEAPKEGNKFGPAMEMLMKSMQAAQPQAMGGMPMMPMMPQQMPMMPQQMPNMADKKLKRGMNPMMMGLLGGGM